MALNEIVDGKVFVGVPTNNVKHYCLGKLVKSLRALEGDKRIVINDDTRKDDLGFGGNRSSGDKNEKSYAEEIASLGFEVHRVGDTVDAKEKPRIRERLITTRKLLRQLFLDSDCEYFMFIDSDVIVPFYALTRLRDDMIKYNADIVSGVYWQNDRDGRSRPLIFKYLDKESYEVGLTNLAYPLTIADLVPSRVIGTSNSDIQITALGFGCLMMSRKLMKDPNWDFRWDESDPNRQTTEDMWWCIDIKRLGYNILCDTGIMCQHYPKAWEGKI